MMILKCIRYIKTENLLLLKDLSELQRLKSIHRWFQYQKNVYTDKLDDIVHEYNNTYHRTNKMKPIDVKDNAYIDSTELRFKKEVNDKDPKFKAGHHVRISKYKNIFAMGYISNQSEEVFVVKKVKNIVPWTYVINDLKGQEIVGTFYEKELEETNQQEFN